MGRKKRGRTKKPTPQHGLAWPRWTGFRGTTVRDWLPIVGTLLIPVVVAAGGWWITLQQGKIADQRAETDRELAEQRVQYETLQAYLDQMSELILNRNLLESEEGDAVYTLAQARTSTAIRQLDEEHNQAATRFLSDSGLLEKPALLVKADLQNVELPKAMLQRANLAGTKLNGANLADAMLVEADFSDVKKVGEDKRAIAADLTKADLSKAALQGASLSLCILKEATLTHAALQSADLRGASLQEADLSYAGLSYADLTDADLTDADLSGADLTHATVTQEQLDKAKSLKGATMPNGQSYEDWLKDKGGRKEDGENG